MNLNNLNIGKQLIEKVLAEKKENTKQWTKDQQQDSQTIKKNIRKGNQNE